MNNTKTTKRALLSSVMAMFICVAMLIGTTFAWFTDSASTAVNKIQAGTLQIELQYATAWDTNGNPTAWADAEGKTLNFRTADGRTDNILWEPGCTYELPAIRIVNKGNLALKYELAITGIKGDAKLNDAIEWKNGSTDALLSEYTDTMIPGQHNNVTDPIVIKGHMKEDAGNEYQGLSIDGIGIIVYATQDTVEYDSTTDQYDATAEYDTAAVTATELADVMTPDENGVINLEKNYIVTDAWTSLTSENFSGKSSVVINGNGHTISSLNKPLVAGNAAANITINDLTINASSIGIAANENGLGTAAFVSYMDANTSATFKKCHLVNSSVTGNERAAALVSFASCATLTIEDCSVENCEIKAVGGAGGLVGYSSATTTITNSSVKKTSVTATEDRYNNGDPKTPVAGGVIGTVGGATTFTNVTATEVTVSNTNATPVYNDMIGRISGGTIN